MKVTPGYLNIYTRRMAHIGEEEDPDGGGGEEPVSKGHPRLVG